jgi:hypothetical protein
MEGPRAIQPKVELFMTQDRYARLFPNVIAELKLFEGQRWGGGCIDSS